MLGVQSVPLPVALLPPPVARSGAWSASIPIPPLLLTVFFLIEVDRQP